MLSEKETELLSNLTREMMIRILKNCAQMKRVEAATLSAITGACRKWIMNFPDTLVISLPLHLRFILLYGTPFIVYGQPKQS